MTESQIEKLLRIDTLKSETRLDNNLMYNRYEAIPYHALFKLLNHYEISKDDHFVDFGSGKGRFSFFINYYAKSGCTGVEMIEEFHKKAIQNLRNFQNQNLYKDKLKFVNCLAEKYVVSTFENKFFFFNPFSLQVFICVINNIIDSYEDEERSIDIVLYYPSFEFINYLERNTAFMHLMDIDVCIEKDDRDKFSIYRIGGIPTQSDELFKFSYKYL